MDRVERLFSAGLYAAGPRPRTCRVVALFIWCKPVAAKDLAAIAATLRQQKAEGKLTRTVETQGSGEERKSDVFALLATFASIRSRISPCDCEDRQRRMVSDRHTRAQPAGAVRGRKRAAAGAAAWGCRQRDDNGKAVRWAAEGQGNAVRGKAVKGSERKGSGTQ